MNNHNDADSSEKREPQELIELIQSGEAARAIEICLAFPELALAEGKGGRTALMAAARIGDMRMLATLVPLSNCEALDHQGRSALLDAAWGFEPEHGQAAARLILEGVEAKGAHPRVGRAMAVAAERQMPGFVAAALGAFSAVVEEPESLDEALLAAARGGCVESAQILVQAGAASTAKDKDGRDAVMWASSRGCVDLLRAAIHSGSAFSKDKFGKTALMIAAQAGKIDAVKALIPWSNLRELNNRRQTALMLAACGGSRECVEALLPGSDALAVDRDGATALMRSAGFGASEALRALLPSSAPDAVDKRGDTCLAMAIRGRSEACVEILAPLANVHQKNNEGDSPLALALQSSPAILREMIRAGLAQARARGKSGVQDMEKEWRKAIARRGGEKAPSAQALFDAEVERFEMDAAAKMGEGVKMKAVRI